MHSSSRPSTPKAPKLRNIALPPASPAIKPKGNPTYSSPTIIANLKISTLSPSSNNQTALQTSPLCQMSQNTKTQSSSIRPLKGILKNSSQGTQSTPSQASSITSFSSSSQKSPLKSILKKPRSERRQEDFQNATAHPSAQSSISAGMNQSLAPHEVRPSDVGTPGADGGLKPGVVSLNWILVHQDKEKKRPEQFRHLQKGFDMAFRPDTAISPGAWVYDTVAQTYLNPVEYVKQSASTHSTLRSFPLHIVTAWNPHWKCTVQPSSRGILCIDVFRAIFDMLQAPLTNDELGMMNMAILEHARCDRIRMAPHAPREYLRVDSLGPHRHFKSLRQKGSDWILDILGPMD